MQSDFYCRFQANSKVRAPERCNTLDVIDMHTGGEPLRVVTSGYPDIAANTLLGYRRTLKDQHDWLRTTLMYEPRGHADMYGCLVLPPFNPQADCSVIFMHNEGYSTMCGHAVIAIMTLATEMGWVDVDADGHSAMTIEAPCGLINAKASTSNSKVSASFECVDSFVAELDAQAFIPSLDREIQYDLAYGGAFYAYVDAEDLGISLVPSNIQRVIELGTEIKQCVIKQSDKISHPMEDDLSLLYGTIFIGGPNSPGTDSRNVCIFADGEVDRSPTGSGVSGRMAIHHARGEIEIGQRMVIESVLGTRFCCHVERVSQYGPHQSVIPCVSGEAYLSGTSQFIIDPNDPLKSGFLLR